MISGIRLCIFISFIFVGCQGQPMNINIQKLAEYARDTVWLEFKPSTKTTNPKSYDFLSLTEMSGTQQEGAQFTVDYNNSDQRIPIRISFENKKEQEYYYLQLIPRQHQVIIKISQLEGDDLSTSIPRSELLVNDLKNGQLLYIEPHRNSVSLLDGQLIPKARIYMGENGIKAKALFEYKDGILIEEHYGPTAREQNLDILLLNLADLYLIFNVDLENSYTGKKTYRGIEPYLILKNQLIQPK
jgi:hypothetical protein